MRACVCVRARVSIHAFVYTRMCVFMHECMRVCVCLSCTCMYVYVFVCACTCVRVCVCVRVFARVCVGTCTCMGVYAGGCACVLLVSVCVFVCVRVFGGVK